MTKDATTLPDVANNPFADLERQFDDMESKQDNVSDTEEVDERDILESNEPEPESKWDEPEKKPEKYVMEKRVSKLVHQLNQERERASLLEQEKQAYHEQLVEAEKEKAQKDILLLEGYKVNKTKELLQYEKLYDQALEEGDGESRLKISSKIRELNGELSKLDYVLEDKVSYRQQANTQPANTYQQPQQPQVNPLVMQFYQRNPEIQTDQRLAMRAKEIDDKLAQAYRDRGEANLIGSVQYMQKLEAGYRGQFNRPSSNNGQTSEKRAIPLSPQQQMMAEDIFGTDPVTSRKRSAKEAHDLYRNSLRSRR